MKIRLIEPDDAKKLMVFFGKLVSEDPNRAETLQDVQARTIEKENGRTLQRISDNESDECISLVISNDENIYGDCEIKRLKRLVDRHVGELSFGILTGFEDYGKQMIDGLLQKAKEIGIELVYFVHLESQVRGIKLVSELGFQQSGKIDKYYKLENKNYISRVIYTKIL